MSYKVVPEGDHEIQLIALQQSLLLQGSGSSAIPLVCNVM